MSRPLPRTDAAGWEASLELRFARAGERTVLERAAHVGPLRVQRPFHPEGPDVPHVYVLHPPGGVVGGDVLALALRVGEGAAALVTTPAASKLYRSASRTARIEVTCEVAAGAALEYLPQETIAFDGCRAHTTLRVELARGARFLGWEVIALGRPAAGEGFDHGELVQRIEVWRDGAPLLVERSRYAPGVATLSAAWGLRGQTVVGTFVCAGGAVDIDGSSALLPPPRDGAAASVTRLEEDLVVARYLGDDPVQARRWFEALRAQLRPALVGRAAIEPRIWAT